MTRPLTAVVLTFRCLAIPGPASLPGAKHETWFEARSPNFVVVTNAGENEARKTAVRFEQIRAVFRRSLDVASKHESPVITILAVKDEDSMKSLLPEYWVKNRAHAAGGRASERRQPARGDWHGDEAELHERIEV